MFCYLLIVGLWVVLLIGRLGVAICVWLNYAYCIDLDVCVLAVSLFVGC